jgi:hypothetical protein
MHLFKALVLVALGAAACGGGGGGGGGAAGPKMSRMNGSDGSLLLTSPAELGDTTMMAAKVELTNMGCADVEDPKPFGSAGTIMMNATCESHNVNWGLQPGSDLITITCKTPVDAAACEKLFKTVLANIHGGGSAPK